MSKWTIKKIYDCKEIVRGSYVDNGDMEVGDHLGLVVKRDPDLFSYTIDGKKLIIPSDKSLENFKFYTHNMQEILPPKQDERVVMYEAIDFNSDIRLCNEYGTVWNFEEKEWFTDTEYSEIRKANRKKEPCGYLNITKNVMEWE